VVSGLVAATISVTDSAFVSSAISLNNPALPRR
jgi:hypothetical protein